VYTTHKFVILDFYSLLQFSVVFLNPLQIKFVSKS
jgi:hypothetical protein